MLESECSETVSATEGGRSQYPLPLLLSSIVPAGVIERLQGVEGRIAAKVQFENIEFALTGRYNRLDNIVGELELIDYKTTGNTKIPDGIDVQLGLYYLALQQVYRRSPKHLTLIFLSSGEKHCSDVTLEHEIYTTL
ncbi:MAG TPA: PD-(D/E)XK nuclease family protein [Stenomitos sp.]